VKLPKPWRDRLEWVFGLAQDMCGGVYPGPIPDDYDGPDMLTADEAREKLRNIHLTIMEHMERSLNPRLALALDRARRVAEQVLADTRGRTRAQALACLDNQIMKPLPGELQNDVQEAWRREKARARAAIRARPR
jgi:hypothetical protein